MMKRAGADTVPLLKTNSVEWVVVKGLKIKPVTSAAPLTPPGRATTSVWICPVPS